MPDRADERISAKRTWMAAVSILFAAFFGYEFRLIFSDQSLERFLWLAGAAILWLTVAALRPFLVSSAKFAALVAGIEAIAIWLMLPRQFEPLALVGTAALFAFLIFGFLRGRALIRNALAIKFTQVSYRIVPFTMNGVALFITLYLMAALQFPSAEIPKDAFQFFFKSSETVAAKFFPGFSAEKPVDEVLRIVIASRFPAGTPESTIREATDNLKVELTERARVDVRGEERFIDAIYRVTVAKILALPPVVKTLTAIALGIIMFGIVRSIAFFLNWAIRPLSFGLYRLLIAFNFIRIGLENRRKEVIIV